MSERLTVGVAARLSRYLQVLTQAKKMGRSSISSQDVSEYTHINATQIRRDLSAFGKFGKRGVGYNIDALIAEIRGILRTSGQHNIALIGAGRLGQAIAGSSIFADHGFHIVTIFDDDPAKIGTELRGVPIRSTGELTAQVAEHNIIAAVIAVPAGAAQTVADQLVQAGVHIIFNYSEALLQTPADVDRAQLQPGGRATARALLLPHVGVRESPAGARRRARRASRRPRAARTRSAARPTTRWTSRRRRPCPGEGSTTAAIAPRERYRHDLSRVCRTNALVRSRRWARASPTRFWRSTRRAITSPARRISPSRSRRSSRSSTPRRTTWSTASPSSRRAPTPSRSASTRRAS